MSEKSLEVLVQQALQVEEDRQNKEEVDEDAVESLCDEVEEFPATTVEHMQGLLQLTTLSASPDLRSSAAIGLGSMDTTLVAGQFNAMVRGDHEQRELAMEAMSAMRLGETSSLAVAMNESGGVVDFLLDFLASDAPGLNRSTAASLLGSIGLDLGRVVPALEAAVAEGDDWVSQDAVWALEEIEDR